MSIFNKIFGDPMEKYIKGLQPMVEEIRGLESKYQKMSYDDLRGLAEVWRGELKKGKSLDDILPEVFAGTREAARRQMGSGHFDVQMIGAKVLHEGKIAEMKTGEGKTSYAVSPAAVLNALTGKGVHVVTVNDYLSKRDAAWIGAVYDAVGLTVGVIVHDEAYIYDKSEIRNSKSSPNPKSKIQNGKENSNEIINQLNNDPVEDNLKLVSRKEAYQCDITYGTNNEFGFDYLRDNMAQSLEQKVQRGFNFAIVDEVDSILIDEARTPLIISAPAEEAGDKYRQFASLIPRLKEGEDYNIDEKMRSATLTEEGIKKMEKWLGVENIYTEKGVKEVHHIEQALKAQVLFQRDKDYVVKDGEVVIVDEFTGRMMYGRRYSEGLHQAIEAKEGVDIKQESVTMATITFQNYFRMYEKLSGMTGTALTEAEEFAKIYSLDVIPIPTNKPIVRIDRQDLIYKNEAAKFKAVIEDIKKRQEKGQPVLVGTISIEKNELLSTLLDREGVDHNTLNAKNHAKEAQFIAEAGKPGKVTLATNMAGRGVDIKLGGEGANKEEEQVVKDLGGLYVIGTERHESRRIDNQLRGRSGRQGDPGESRFYVSTEDDLMRIFGSERIAKIMNTLKMPDDMPIEHKMISKSLETAQKKVEGRNFDIRKHLLEYDDVINKHREVVYRKRNRILEIYEGFKNPKSEIRNEKINSKSKIKNGKAGEEAKDPAEARSFREIIMEMVEGEIEQVVSFHTQSDDEQSWNIDEIYEVCDTIFPLPLEVRLKMDDIQKTAGDKVADTKARDKLINYLVGLAREAYDELEERVNGLEVENQSSDNSVRTFTDGGKESAERENVEIRDEEKPVRIKPMQEVEKMILLRAIDMLWVEHIDAMDHLRTGIGLRGYGQKDPLVEYKREAYKMFVELQNNIAKQVVYSIYKVGLAQNSMQNAINREQGRERGLIFKGAEKMGNQKSVISPLATTAVEYVERGNQTEDNSNVTVTQPAKMEGVASSQIQAAPVEKQKKVGRNDPCPCGSGKKYKKCCGA